MTNLDYATQKLAEQKKRIRELEHLLDQATSHADECCAEVRRLEKEADWLVMQIDSVLECPNLSRDIYIDCHERCSMGIDTKKCWREAARKAVGHDHE